MHPAPPAMLIVAHGSRDPRHAATVTALATRVRALAPAARVAVGFLELTVPSVPQALSRLHAAGQRAVVVVPLLLSRAYHARTDIPAVLAEQVTRLPGLWLRQAEVLGPAGDAGGTTARLLGRALERRLRQGGVAPTGRAETGVVLASVGTRDPAAIATIEAFAAGWGHEAGWAAVRPAFATARGPRTDEAVRALRAEGLRRVAVAPYAIAPGRLPDRIAAGARGAGADVLAAELGDAPELGQLLLRRYRAAAFAAPAGPTATWPSHPTRLAG